jgi:hypothetical protein
MIPLIRTPKYRAGRRLDEDKRAALECFLDAWGDAVEIGIDGEVAASAAIYVAISELVDAFGEDPVAKLLEDLPRRVRNGEFTVQRVLQ